jgi:hypothetical protein
MYFGGNYYPWNTRNLRMNIQVINVDPVPGNRKSPRNAGSISSLLMRTALSGLLLATSRLCVSVPM